MTLAIRPDVSGVAPEISDLPVPSAHSSLSPALHPPTVSPEGRVSLYSADEWECFVVEWAHGLGCSYHQIKRLGGPGDRGIDVAAFKTDRGLEGEWDCFQAKHYNRPLKPSDVFPEMLKFLHGVVSGFYCLPRRYVFVAPRGCGTSLNYLLSKPTALRKKFLDYLNKPSGVSRKYGGQALNSIRELAESINFSIFQSLELNEMLETHRATRYSAARFGTALPARPPVEQVPVTPMPDETLYVKKLVDVYSEQDPVSCSDVASVASHAKYGAQFQRQREAFYSAEALRLYARDSVPEGTYERLQNDVFTGVIDTAESDHSSGLNRLRAVLTQSGILDLNAHALIKISRIEDRHGICHQLANVDKLTWVDTNE